MIDPPPCPTLVSICQASLLEQLERTKFNGRMINDLCKYVLDGALLEPIFEKILATRAITDVSLIAYLVPSRLSLKVTATPHIRNSVFKLIGLNCPHLTHVDLSDCGQVSNSVVRAILQGCSKLQHIALNRCRRITDSAFDLSWSPFEPLLGCLSLESVSLQGCPQITGEVVGTLNKNCRSLTQLNLSQCKQLQAPAVQSLFLHNHLRVLNLAFIDGISDEAFLLLPVPMPSGLQILNLCKSRITDSSMQRLRMRSLLEIHLQWCAGITDAGVQALASGSPLLQVIDLKSCAVTDLALFALAELCRDLRDLDLSWCFAVTDEGLRRLVPSLLEKLSLVWCPQVSDATLGLLCDMDSLRSVQLSGCTAITPEGLWQLETHGIDAIS